VRAVAFLSGLIIGGLVGLLAPAFVAGLLGSSATPGVGWSLVGMLVGLVAGPALAMRLARPVSQ
jgi:hypothetical protein